MNKISWGIIGCGNVTEVKSGPAFRKVPGSDLVAVMRRDAARAADYAARHGVGRWYADAKDLISDPEVNAVYIATPPDVHEAYALQCLEAGKPVYVEKPMTLDAPAARRLQAAADRSGVPLCVAHYRRQQPYFQKIRELLSEGAIGSPRIVSMQLHQPPHTRMIAQTEVPWRLDPAVSGGGLFHDLAPHGLDLMRYFFGPAEASGFSANQGRYYEADDAVAGVLRFQSGLLFTGSWSFAAAEAEQRDVCTITGPEGSITFSVFGPQQLVVRNRDGEAVFDFTPPIHVQQPMIEAVVQHFLGQGPNPCPAGEGAEVMEWMDAFTRRN